MKAKEIRDLIDFISETGLEEVNIETEAFKINVKRSSPQVAVPPALPAAPIAAPPSAPPATPPSVESPKPASPEPASSSDAHLITVKSPMIGTFYRSSSPDTDPFASIGSTIKPGDTLCIIEAMKLFNEIESEVSGKVVKILVENAEPVEYDQPLFLVDPS